jgi:23S rRNA (cytidine1920-2'-O)/16S rRNA (cytidine1409-2'-O)-methyltransferase
VCAASHIPYSAAMSRTRLDTLLVERGLFESRSRASAAILAGSVRIGPDRRRAEKPGQLVAADVPLEVERPARFVSRGGIKLENALQAYSLDVAGRRALDVGASTGGFSDCLLQRGVAHVVAVDVGYGMLDWRLRSSERVTVRERVNARALDCAALPYCADLIVVDVSFISLRKVLPAVLACAASEFDCVALVKPQFEVGRERVGKGGVVRLAADRRSALVEVARAVVELGYSVCGLASSELPGPAGNRETFVWVRAAGDARALGDLEAAAARVEP